MIIDKLKKSAIKAFKSLYKMLPLILGVLLLVSLIPVLIPKSFYLRFFQKNPILDSVTGSIIGSISAGSPITSYILGGEFLKDGVSLTAVTAFIVAWVTVGIIQLPAESLILGKKFAIIRNATSFLFAVIVALITVFLLNVM
ncbi:hypothetical protein KAS56_01285 [candidate division WOR-3 bacterium]|nr:hypothetical protein [candidate division WOR-3 bacterium]